jgi:hypothetical protein
MTTLNPVVARVLKRLHYRLDVILMSALWYVAYQLSLRHLEEMMVERGVSVDHSTGRVRRPVMQDRPQHLHPSPSEGNDDLMMSLSFLAFARI